MYASWPQSAHFSGSLWSMSTGGRPPLALARCTTVATEGFGRGFPHNTSRLDCPLIGGLLLEHPFYGGQARRTVYGERRGWVQRERIPHWRRRSPASKAG